MEKVELEEKIRKLETRIQDYRMTLFHEDNNSVIRFLPNDSGYILNPAQVEIVRRYIQPVGLWMIVAHLHRYAEELFNAAQEVKESEALYRLLMKIYVSLVSHYWNLLALDYQNYKDDYDDQTSAGIISDFSRYPWFRRFTAYFDDLRELEETRRQLNSL